MPATVLNLKPESVDNAAITEYSVTRTNFHHPGLVQMPPLGEGDSEFARNSGPWEQEIIVWEAKKEGGPPVVPSPVDPNGPLGHLNANRVLLDFKIGMPIVMPIGGGSGGHIWIIGGTAVYGKYTVEGVVRNYPTGTMPWEQGQTQKQYRNYFPAENFKMDIVDPRPVETPEIELQTPLGP